MTPLGSTNRYQTRGCLPAFLVLAILGSTSVCVPAEPPPAAAAAFNSYANAVEARLAAQHRSKNAFLSAFGRPADWARLRAGDLIVERLTPRDGAQTAGAMLQHWRGTTFAPGATTAEFERLLRDFDSYPRYFSPQVVEATVIAQTGDHLEATMRVRQRHVITVVMDADYDVTFGRLDAQHGYSISRSTRISEIGSARGKTEHVLNAGEEHGFLWRLNTYWSCEERDGGLYIQMETVSLTRSIPTGLGWAVGPFVESVPKGSVEFTLRAVCNALRKPQERWGRVMQTISENREETDMNARSFSAPLRATHRASRRNCRICRRRCGSTDR